MLHGLFSFFEWLFQFAGLLLFGNFQLLQFFLQGFLCLGEVIYHLAFVFSLFGFLVNVILVALHFRQLVGKALFLLFLLIGFCDLFFQLVDGTLKGLLGFLLSFDRVLLLSLFDFFFGFFHCRFGIFDRIGLRFFVLL